VNSERIGLLLRHLPELQGLTRQIERLSSLQATLAASLPAPIAASVALAVAENGDLVLFADNGAVATKLKHLAPRILLFLRQRGIEVTGIRVQVQAEIRHNPLPRKQIFLGPEGRKAIQSLAERIENSPLRNALEQLSRRGKVSDDRD
jgi:hypothetical protein